MEVKINTRSSLIIFFAIVVSIFLFGALAIAKSNWPPVFSPEWVIGLILLVATSIGFLGYWIWVLFPSVLIFRLLEDKITISNRKFFRTEHIDILPSDIYEFVFNSESASFVKLKSGKKIWISDFLLHDKENCIKEIKALFPSIKLHVK